MVRRALSTVSFWKSWTYQSRVKPPHTALLLESLKEKHDEHEDGGVEEEEHQQDEQPGERSVSLHSSTASPSPSPKRFITPMQMRTITIITREMALPRWGL